MLCAYAVIMYTGVLHKKKFVCDSRALRGKDSWAHFHFYERAELLGLLQ